MRFVIPLLFLLAFPALVLAFRQQFLQHLQPKLDARLRSVLQTPGLSTVEADVNYLDVTLRGTVSEPALRERARHAVDSLPGLRCREGDNLLRVRPQITAMLDGASLSLSGWLKDQSSLHKVTAWVSEMRPDLKLDASDVQIDPYVVALEASPVNESTPELAQVWTTLQAPASLRVSREGDTFRVSGHLTSMNLRQAIVLAVPLGEGVTPLDFSTLHAGPYVQPAPFADAQALPALLSVFLTSPGAQRIEASGQELTIRGYATPTIRDRWMKVLNLFPEQMTIIAGFEVFPSPYHFPSYKEQSRLSPEKLADLKKVLSQSVIHFQIGASAADPSQVLALDVAAAAILEAGPEARVLIGAQPLTGETPEITRRRAEAVRGELAGRGVPLECLETELFEQTITEGDGAPRVEMLVK